jgi:hypothetical protein
LLLPLTAAQCAVTHVMSPADPNPQCSPSPTSVSVMAERRRQAAGAAGQGESAPNVNGKDPVEAAERAVKKSRTEPQEAQGIPLCGGVGQGVGAGDGGRGTSGCAGDGCGGGARGRKASGVEDRDDYSAVDGLVGAELAGAHASVESRKAVRGVGDSDDAGGAVGVVLPMPHLSLSAFSHSQHLFLIPHTNFGNYV